MTTTPRHTCSICSFESSYVSLDLLAYLNSNKITPFHIFNDVIMPEFQCHLSKIRQLLPPKELNGSQDNNTSWIESVDMDVQHATYEEIKKDLNYIYEACHKLKGSVECVNKEVQQLILKRLDDAYKERTEVPENSPGIDKLKSIQKVVSETKKNICSSSQLSQDSLHSASLHHSSFSVGNYCINPDSSTTNKIKKLYNDLDDTQKSCLLCFSVFPEDAIIKKKVLIHWWVGERFIDSSNSDGKTAEETGKEYFKDFINNGIIKPVHEGRQNSENCKMQPLIRAAIIMLAKDENFVSFDQRGNPTADFSSSKRVCLVKTEEGSSLHNLTYIYHDLPRENIRTLFNVNEPYLSFRVDSFSKMKKLKVLQLGRWKASAKQLVEVENTEFLKGLKKMKELRYFSLRGISGITELPNSICKLSNLRILNLSGCDNLEKLPDGIGSLKQLTHLDMSECFLISHMPKGLASLLALQILKGFVIGKQSPSGLYCKLADLARLRHLRKLSIHVDRTCASSGEQELKSLAQFRKLQSLSVAWSSIYNATTNVGLAKFQRMVSRENSMKALAKIPRLLSREKPMPTTPGSTSHSSQPADLHKLGLQYFHGSKMPDWLRLLKLENLKKLYIRGGELSDLWLPVGNGYHSWAVECLRLKCLSKLEMDWPTLQQQLFPKLKYAEKVDCPQLKYAEKDDNGEWIWNAEDATVVEGADTNGNGDKAAGKRPVG